MPVTSTISVIKVELLEIAFPWECSKQRLRILRFRERGGQLKIAKKQKQILGDNQVGCRRSLPGEATLAADLMTTSKFEFSVYVCRSSGQNIWKILRVQRG